MAERSEGNAHAPHCPFCPVLAGNTEFPTGWPLKRLAPEICTCVLKGGSRPRVMMGLSERSGWNQTWIHGLLPPVPALSPRRSSKPFCLSRMTIYKAVAQSLETSVEGSHSKEAQTQWLKHEKCIPHSSGGWKFKFKLSAGLVSPRLTVPSLSLACSWPSSPCCPQLIFPPSLRVLISLSFFKNDFISTENICLWN